MGTQEQANFAELVSLMFNIGRFMREPARGNRAERQASLLQFEALRFVKEHGQPHMREIAGHFRITPPAATLLIDGLVRDKFLVRIFDKKDRRAVRVELTVAGKSLLLRGMKEKMKKLQTMFSALSGEEQRELLSMLRKMAERIRVE